MSSTRALAMFGVVSLALLVASMQGTMVSVALPDMVSGLDAPLRLIGWVITIFSVTQAVSMPVAGRLSDELGRRRVFVGGMVVFTLATVVCGLASNVYVLIAARAVQGIAGGTQLPSAYGIVGDAFPGNRARALGMIATVFSLGAVLSPTAGTLVVEQFGWRGTFLATVPLSALAGVAGFMLLRDGEAKPRVRIDAVGMALLTVAMLLVTYGLTELGRRGAAPDLRVVVGSFVLAAIATVVFVRFEARAAFPIIDLALLRRRDVAYMMVLNFCYGFGMFPALTFLPLYGQLQYGFSIVESGALLNPRAIASVIVSPIASVLLVRTGYRGPVFVGLAMTGGAQLLLSMGRGGPVIAGLQLSDFAWVALLTGLTGVAFGIADPAANNSAVELTPESPAAITGLRAMFRHLGVAFGSAAIVVFAERAPSLQAGMAQSFAVLGVVCILCMAFVLGIPDKVGSGWARVRDAVGTSTARR